MSLYAPFTPVDAGTNNIVANLTSANEALNIPANSGTKGWQVRVAALAAGAIAFIRFGVAGVVADAATDLPILPGATEIFSIGPGITHVAAISATGNTLYFTVGS